MLSFLGFVSLGLLHGLVLLPTLLYWTAPDIAKADEETGDKLGTMCPVDKLAGAELIVSQLTSTTLETGRPCSQSSLLPDVSYSSFKC
jgi:hypothetical protein